MKCATFVLLRRAATIAFKSRVRMKMIFRILTKMFKKQIFTAEIRRKYTVKKSAIRKNKNLFVLSRNYFCPSST